MDSSPDILTVIPLFRKRDIYVIVQVFKEMQRAASEIHCSSASALWMVSGCVSSGVVLGFILVALFILRSLCDNKPLAL